MAKKKVSICDGKIIVVVKDNFDVYEKPLPEGLDPDINWIGNFGISEAGNGKKLKGKVPKYEVIVLDMPGKTLYYWDGSKKKKFPDQRTTRRLFKKYRKAELDLGDPPVEWS